MKRKRYKQRKLWKQRNHYLLYFVLCTIVVKSVDGDGSYGTVDSDNRIILISFFVDFLKLFGYLNR